MIGEFPGLARLDDDGNLRPTSDFRGLYAALLESWFETDAAGIVPDAGRFARPRILRGSRRSSRHSHSLPRRPPRGCR